MAQSVHFLSGIASRAFLLGILCAICSTTAVLLGLQDSQWWRLPAYLSTMSIFHFLEFYATARWNSPRAELDSFLLSTHAYMYAHLYALAEIVISAQCFPNWYARFVTPGTIVGGALLTILGQVIRTSAMMQAGLGFNHQIENQGREDHKLITTGLYSWSRHPSYIGLYLLFVGIQLMVGNKFAALFLAYAL